MPTKSKDPAKLTRTGDYISRGNAARRARDRTPIGVVLPQELIQWCDEEAERTGTNRSAVIDKAIRHYSGKF